MRLLTMCFIISLLISLLVVGCGRNLTQASSPYHASKQDCTWNPVNQDCVTITETKSSVGAFGAGYPGGMVPMMLTAGQQALVAYPGSAVGMGVPVTAPMPASPPASSAASSSTKLPMAAAKLAIGASKEAKKAKELACKALAAQGKTDPGCPSAKK